MRYLFTRLFVVITLFALASCKKDKVTGSTMVLSTPQPFMLNCDAATASAIPSAGAFYSGTVMVPYSAGDGSIYGTGNPIPSTGVTGLTAVLQAGILGLNGKLVYNITGKPATSGTPIFPISMNSKSCSFSVVVYPMVNTAPIVSVAATPYIPFPVDSCILNGYARDPENNIMSYSWRKSAGPASCVFDHSDSLTTKVRNLQPGDYEFELTVTDSLGLKGKSAVKVFVLQPGLHETIFRELEWSCPMGCSVVINNFSSFIPAGRPIQVFLRQSAGPTWYQVKPPALTTSSDKYSYVVGVDYLVVYTDDELGMVDIKVQY